MMEAGPQKKRLYIFSAMTPRSGYDYLKVCAQNNPERFQIGMKLWLLRESSTQKGMLTVDSIVIQGNKKYTVESSRLSLHPKFGWISANTQEQIEYAVHQQIPITKELAQKHKRTLERLLEKSGFQLSCRILPKVSQASQTPLYSGYCESSEDTELSEPSDLNLGPEVARTAEQVCASIKRCCL